jgi:FSR family fosmidomycin resistance protein-like MFS transporter
MRAGLTAQDPVTEETSVARMTGTVHSDAKVISLVCFPHMMSHVYWLVIPPMYPVLMSVFSLNYTEAGAIMTAFAAATMIAQTPVGFLVDKIGARTVLIVGLALEGAAIGAFGLATAYWQFLPLAVLAGLGHTVFHPADYAILSARVSEERMGRAFSIHTATGYAGFALAPIFMTTVAALWHWRAAFLLIGVIGLVAALVLLTQSAALKDDGAVDGKPGSKKSEPAPPMTLSQGMRLILSFPILMCFLYFVLHQMGGGGVRTFLIAALNEMYGTPEVVAAFALSAFTLGSVFGILSGGFVADRFGPQVWTAIATLIPAALIIALLGWIDIQGVMLVVLLAVSGYLIGLLIPSRDLLLRSVTPPGSMGKVMGFASTGSNLGGALIPLVLGYFMDNAGGQWVFWISAIFIGAAFLTFVTARSKYAS